jgi:hypothetical protein
MQDKNAYIQKNFNKYNQDIDRKLKMREAADK